MPSIAASKPPLQGVTRAVLARGPSAQMGEQSRDEEEYHPAIGAQAIATLGLPTDGRFTLGLGSGERLNEHVIGLGWLGIVERHERHSEAVDIIQRLLKAELSNYAGKYLRLGNAKLYDLPRNKPLVVIAAGGPRHR